MQERASEKESEGERDWRQGCDAIVGFAPDVGRSTLGFWGREGAREKERGRKRRKKKQLKVLFFCGGEVGVEIHVGVKNTEVDSGQGVAVSEDSCS